MQKNKENVERWIATLAAAQRILLENKYFDPEAKYVSFYNPASDYIVIGMDVKEIAQILELEITKNQFEDGTKEVFFKYGGIKFLGLEEQKNAD